MHMCRYPYICMHMLNKLAFCLLFVFPSGFCRRWNGVPRAGYLCGKSMIELGDLVACVGIYGVSYLYIIVEVFEFDLVHWIHCICWQFWEPHVPLWSGQPVGIEVHDMVPPELETTMQSIIGCLGCCVLAWFDSSFQSYFTHKAICHSAAELSLPSPSP